MQILVLNCGSSSAKFAVMDTASGQEVIAGLAQRIGSPQATLGWKMAGVKAERAIPGADHKAALETIVGVLRDLGLADGIRGIGHRVVHGGEHFSASRIVDATVVEGIRACIPLGPLHNPANLVGIELGAVLFPGLAQVAVFDTAFHQTMPRQAYLYAVPWAWYEEHHARRYGFHGTSHRFVSRQAAEQLGRPYDQCRTIVAHLGNGCSACAIKDGESVDTTMGLTPLEGLVMGTRSGDVDPALIGYVASRLGIPADKVIDALNKQSGLQGLSGLSNDMRTLLEAAGNGNDRAQLAVEVFVYRLAKAIAGLAVPLGRIDALVFTGGIGENAAPIRAQILDQLAVFGFRVDEARNRAHGRSVGGRITADGATVALVVPTNEELMIALDTAALVAA
jgi:acetate kinase